MGNYHYMVYIVTALLLFAPRRRESLKVMIVGFYVAAGLLKINIDWLSGAAMIRTPALGGDLLVTSLFYVVFLELVLVFGLLHHKRWVRAITLLQLLCFHAFSWHIVGFFYPMMMFSVLSLFVLDEFIFNSKREQSENILLHLFSGRLGRSTYVVLIVFWLCQVIPFGLTTDPSLSGALRLSSLNMFDSKTQCHSLLVAKTEQGTVHLQKPMKNLGTRLSCDPLIYLNQAHQLCRANRDSKEIKQLSLTLFAKRVTEQHYKKSIDIKNVCELSNPLWAELYSGESS